MSDRFEVLLVEDDPTDVYLIQEAFKTGDARVKLRTVPDGEEALAYLRRSGAYKKARRPDAIVLDLNLPKLDGREVLEIVKADKDLRSIPVLVLTTSSRDEDVAASYGLGANCFVTKPMSLKEHDEAMRAIQQFWFGVARLPGKPARPRPRE